MMAMTASPLGTPINRLDGRAKVTGQARYAAEHRVPDLAHGWVVGSDVAVGRIVRIDATEALALPGVLQVFTHENRPPLARDDESYRDEVSPATSAPFRPLYDSRIRFSAQPVALVVAETLELARYAATLVRVEYERSPHATDLQAQRGAAYEPKPRTPVPHPRGDADRALAQASVQIDVQSMVPVEHHNPMELFATTAVREPDGRLTVYDKTQGVQNVHGYLCKTLGCQKDQLRVVTPFVGGAFGSGLRPQFPALLAVLAARALNRSVRVSLTRQQMFGLTHRPATWQRVALGATADGRLEAVIHEAVAETSRYEDFNEAVVPWSGLLYRCDNVRLDHKVTQLDLCTPGDMRAPGASWGVYALECAMDELAVKLGIDPLDLRLRNYADRDLNDDRPFSSKELRACYQQAAERFGWSRRDPRPRSMRQGSSLVGWGMAGGVWEAMQVPASARAVLTTDGKLAVSSATEDIGTGTYTVMTQIAAEVLGLPIEAVTFTLGDSSLPAAPVQGGSFTVASVGSAVEAACDKLRERLLGLARRIDGSPLAALAPDEMSFAEGTIRSRRDPARAVPLADVLRRAGLEAVEDEASAEPSTTREQYSCNAHTAVFAEVRVDEDLGTVQVTRIVSAVAAGRILSPKMARSQISGAIVGGIGMALEEESLIDQAFGRFMNHSLADYHVPVNADVPDIEVIFVEERDDIVNSLGAKGLAEIGIVGVAAAIANAVFHATGTRIRDLPIRPDRLLDRARR
jgi:xanthine dehydrogenase YagR molybdenum-binding subunit